MSKTGEPRLNYAEAKRRALDRLTNNPMGPATVAHGIWPRHTMRAQGAARAASAILNRMQKEGLAYRTTNQFGFFGWVKL